MTSEAGPDSALRLRSDGWRSREAILDAAQVSLARDRRTTMQEIAEAAGVGRTTIYRYFPTRRDLEQALSERAHTSATRRATGSEANQPRVPVDGSFTTTPSGGAVGGDTAQLDRVRPAGQLGREGSVSLDAIHVLDSVSPHLVAEQLVAEAQRIAGMPVALYLVDIDGRRLVRLAGSREFPTPLGCVAPPGRESP